MDGGTASRDGRGMTNLVGIVLLLGLTLVGAIAVVVVGSAALGAAADQTEDDTTEDSMREMTTRLDGVADSSVDEATSFQMEGNVNVSSAWFNITAQNNTGSEKYHWNRSLGTLVSEQSDGSLIAYQAGGLWRAGDGETMMLNEPGLDYDGSTLDLSLVNVSRLNAISKNGEVVAKKDVERSRAIQEGLASNIRDAWTTDDGTVPVDVTITIKSAYADGWAKYARNDMTVTGASVAENDGVVKITFDDLGSATSGTGAGGGTGTGPGPGGPSDGSESDYDRSMRYDEGENALQVNREVGNLSLLTAQIGEPVEIERVVEDEEYRDPMDVVFAIDETGSMENNDRDDERLSATRNFIDGLNASNGDRAGYVQFTTDDRDCWYNYCMSNPVPQYQGVIGHNDLTSDLDGLKSDLSTHEEGGTNISRGISVGTEVHTNETDPNEKRVMVLLTDGQNSDPQDNPLTVEMAERAYDRHNIRIYPVGLGNDLDETLLKTVASEANGTYYHAEDADQLQSIFDEIANETRTETIRQINRTRTTLQASQNGTHSVEVSGHENVNNPNFFAESTGFGAVESDLTAMEPGGHLSFVLQLQSCEDYDLTDVNSTRGGESYRHTLCEDGGTETTTIDNSNSDHVVFRDGDDASQLSSLTTDWWHSDPQSYLDRYTDDGAFDLGANESVIALDVEDADGQRGYVLLHFQVEEMEGSTDPPSDPDDSVAGGDAPLDPITIGYSEVGVT